MAPWPEESNRNMWLGVAIVIVLFIALCFYFSIGLRTILLCLVVFVMAGAIKIFTLFDQGKIVLIRTPSTDPRNRESDWMVDRGASLISSGGWKDENYSKMHEEPQVYKRPALSEEEKKIQEIGSNGNPNTY